MKANLKNALMVVAALLVVYVAAFFATMKVQAISLRECTYRVHMLRGHYSNKYYLESHWPNIFFAPLIWMEEQVLPPEYWEWRPGQPKPDWMKPSTP